MPSPFPGFDPFIENQHWETFHARFITALGDALVERLRPRYIVNVDTFVFVGTLDEPRRRSLAPDVAVIEHQPNAPRQRDKAVVTMEPVVRTVPDVEEMEIEQHYLTILSRDSDEVVTMVELLSPWNKTIGNGREDYLRKRRIAFQAGIHLVELDLFRAGTRLPTNEDLPAGDYFAFICRKERHPQVDVFAWALRERMPNIPVPLSTGDADATLELQTIFDTTYDRAGFDYALNYGRSVEPRLGADDEGWARSQLARQ